MNNQLVGWWRVQSIVMPEGKTLSLIGGLPGETVCFTESGHYCIHPDIDETQHYRSSECTPYSHLDVWIQDLEPLTSCCIYEIENNSLRIAVAGRPLGNRRGIERPTELRMDEQLNWAVIEMLRCDPPKKRRSKKAGLNLEHGKFIPEGFLDD